MPNFTHGSAPRTLPSILPHTHSRIHAFHPLRFALCLCVTTPFALRAVQFFDYPYTVPPMCQQQPNPRGTNDPGTEQHQHHQRATRQPERATPARTKQTTRPDPNPNQPILLQQQTQTIPVFGSAWCPRNPGAHQNKPTKKLERTNTSRRYRGATIASSVAGAILTTITRRLFSKKHSCGATKA